MKSTTEAMRIPAVIWFVFAALTGIPPSTQDVASSPNRDSGLPFYAGETLVYGVEWDPPWFLFFLPTMNAGEAELQLLGETEYNDGKALKIVFKARSSGTFAKLAGVKVDDELHLLTDPQTYCTLSVSKRIREGKRKRDIDVVYLRGSGQLHIREVDQSVTPPEIKKDEYKDDIPECVRDPFSALYVLRLTQLDEGQTNEWLIGNDDKVKEVRSQVEVKEVIETPVGKFPAWRVNTVALMGGLFKEGGQFRIWFSADARRIPLQFEAKVRLGRAIGKVKKAPSYRRHE